MHDLNLQKYNQNLQDLQSNRKTSDPVKLANFVYKNGQNNPILKGQEPKVGYYLGSFKALQGSSQERILYVESQINVISERRLNGISVKADASNSKTTTGCTSPSISTFTKQGIQVVIILSLSGVRICNLDLSTTYGLHSLTRICHTTCEPISQLFAYTARDIGSDHYNCYIFQTENAEELSALFDSAFKIGQTVRNDSFNPNSNMLLDRVFDIPESACEVHRCEQSIRASASKNPSTSNAAMNLSATSDFQIFDTASLSTVSSPLRPINTSTTKENFEDKIMNEMAFNLRKNYRKSSSACDTSTSSSNSSAALRRASYDTILDHDNQNCSRASPLPMTCVSKTDPPHQVSASTTFQQLNKAFIRNMPRSKSSRKKNLELEPTPENNVSNHKSNSNHLAAGVSSSSILIYQKGKNSRKSLPTPMNMPAPLLEDETAGAPLNVNCAQSGYLTKNNQLFPTSKYTKSPSISHFNNYKEQHVAIRARSCTDSSSAAMHVMDRDKSIACDANGEFNFVSCSTSATQNSNSSTTNASYSGPAMASALAISSSLPSAPIGAPSCLQDLEKKFQAMNTSDSRKSANSINSANSSGLGSSLQCSSGTSTWDGLQFLGNLSQSNVKKRSNMVENGGSGSGFKQTLDLENCVEEGPAEIIQTATNSNACKSGTQTGASHGNIEIEGLEVNSPLSVTSQETAQLSLSSSSQMLMTPAATSTSSSNKKSFRKSTLGKSGMSLKNKILNAITKSPGIGFVPINVDKSFSDGSKLRKSVQTTVNKNLQVGFAVI